MPVMDGLSAARSIRSLNKPGVKELPIIALTSNGQPEDFQKSFDAGLDDHIIKPLNLNMLKKNSIQMGNINYWLTCILPHISN